MGPTQPVKVSFVMTNAEWATTQLARAVQWARRSIQPVDNVQQLPRMAVGVGRRLWHGWRDQGPAQRAEVSLGQTNPPLPPRGRTLTLTVYVPSQCGLACVFCSTAPGSGLPMWPTSAPNLAAEATQLATVLRDRALAGERIRLLIQGRDVLNAPEGVDVLRALSGVPGVNALLLTPGTRLATPGFARRLAREAPGIALGLTLHAPDATRHDAIAGRPGAFGDMATGIALAHQAGLDVQLAIVVARVNVADVRATLAVAHRWRCRTMVCAFEAHPNHRAAFIATHMPRYADLARALPPRPQQSLRGVVSVPPCVLTSELAAVAVPPGRGVLLPACAGCKFQRSGCSGPPPAYVALYGSDEFAAKPA